MILDAAGKGTMMDVDVEQARCSSINRLSSST